MSAVGVQFLCLLGGLITYVLIRPYFIAWAIGLFTAVKYWNTPSSGTSYYATYIAKFWTKFDLAYGLIKSWRRFVKSYTTKPGPSLDTITALEGFFTRPWFRRVWIIQEIGAAREATIVCGRGRISWTEVCDACKQIHTLISNSSSRSSYIDTYFQRADAIRTALDRSKIKGRKVKLKRSLLFLLHRFGHFEATNPRDKIYGLLGLAGGVVTAGDKVPLIIPDYSKSVVAVYSEFAKFMVLETRSLDILLFGAGVKRLPGLPSWAPDWTYTAYRPESWVHLKRRKTYQLPNYQDAIAVFSEDLTAVSVQGFIVAYLEDEGRVILTTHQAWNDKQNPFFTIINFIILYFIRPFGSIIYKSGVLHVLGRLIRGILLNFGPRRHPLYEFFLEVLSEIAPTPTGENHENDLGDPHHADVGLSSMENILGSILDRDREESELRKIDLVSSHDSLFLVPPCETYAHGVQKGDLFCMVIGASDPFILRRQLNGFELIGTAGDNTFHAVVWRSCVKLWEEGSLELMEFVLR